MEAKLCQSCGMPLSSAEVLGTNADGSLNEEYCTCKAWIPLLRSFSFLFRAMPSEGRFSL